MPTEKPMAVSSQDIIMKAEEPDDFLDIFNRQSIRKESFTPSQRVENSVVEWIQLLKDLVLADLPGLPFPAPLKVHVQRCDKCSQEFFSPINYRRHTHVHHRMKKTDKDSSNIRDPLGAFWDKLSVEKAREVVSFDNVFLEEVPGSSVIKELTKLVRDSVLPALPRVYWEAGSALLDIVEVSSSTSPLSSQELFSILDDASEKTFLCGTADLVQRYMFDGGARKIGLEIKNLVACTSFLFEQKLVKEWLAEKEAEALRLQKMLLEEEEAVQKRQQKRRQKKLRQKERKAKEQKTVDTAEIEDSVGDSSEVALPTETSSSSATSDRDKQNSKDSVAKDQGPVDTAVIKDSVGDSLEVTLPTETSSSSAKSDRDRQNSKDSVAKDQGPVDMAVIKDSVGDSLEVTLPTETSSSSATSDGDRQNSKDSVAKDQGPVDTAVIKDSVGDSLEVTLPTETSSSSATSDGDRQNSKDSVAKDQGPVDMAVIKDSVGDSLEVTLPTETSSSSATSDRDWQNSKDSVAKDQGPVDAAVIKDSVGDSLEVTLPTETSSSSATSDGDRQNSKDSVAKDQGPVDTAVIKDSVGDSLEVTLPTETSSSSATSDRDWQNSKDSVAKDQGPVDTAVIKDSVGDSLEVTLPTETSSSSATSDGDRQNSKDSVAKDQGPVDTAVIKDSVGDSLEVTLPTETSSSSATSDRDGQNSKDSVAKDQGPVDTAVIKDSVGDSLEVTLPTETSSSSDTSDRDRQNSKDSVAKDQGPVDTAVIKDSVSDSLEVLLPTETSSFSATSGRDGQNSDTLPDTDPSIEPVQFSKNEEDVDGESQVTSSSGCDAGRGQDVERQMVQGSGHRHIVGDQQHAPIRSQHEISSGFRPPKFGGKQKHVTIRERAIPGHGNIMRGQKSKPVDDVGSLKTGAHAETMDQPAEEKVNVVLIGSLPVKLYHHKSSSVAEAQDCSLVEHQIPKRNNLPEKPSKPESVHSGYQSTGKCWRPVSHGSRSVVPGNIGVKEFEAEVIAEKSVDQTSSSEGCLISDATEVVNTPESQYEFDVNAAREYLAQTWKEVLEGGEYTILILDSDSESPRNAAAQTESSDSAESGSTDNEENRASGTKLKYVPERRSGT
ncbi:hypothetical protein SLE2022_402300 [Rubroshorea leprosula]